MQTVTHQGRSAILITSLNSHQTSVMSEVPRMLLLMPSRGWQSMRLQPIPHHTLIFKPWPSPSRATQSSTDFRPATHPSNSNPFCYPQQMWPSSVTCQLAIPAHLYLRVSDAVFLILCMDSPTLVSEQPKSYSPLVMCGLVSILMHAGGPERACSANAPKYIGIPYSISHPRCPFRQS